MTEDLVFFYPEDEMIRIARDYQERINRGDFDWYCPYCDEYLTGEDVTYEEMHDTKHGGCGYPVQGLPDPNDGPYDTLEEKYL